MVCVVWALSCKWRANETESQSNSTVQAIMAILDKIWQRFAESHFFQLLLRVTSIRAQACKELASFAMCTSCMMVASITSRTKRVQKLVAIAWLNVAHCPNMPFLHTRKKHSKGEGKTYIDFFSRSRRDHIEQHNAFAPTMHTQTMLHSTRQVIHEFLKAPA